MGMVVKKRAIFFLIAGFVFAILPVWQSTVYLEKRWSEQLVTITNFDKNGNLVTIHDVHLPKTVDLSTFSVKLLADKETGLPLGDDGKLLKDGGTPLLVDPAYTMPECETHGERTVCADTRPPWWLGTVHDRRAAAAFSMLLMLACFSVAATTLLAKAPKG